MEDYISITNKIKVFISSRCGKEYENYNKVRRQLKTSIESTGIADVYIFEGGGSSTQSAEQNYLYALDDSDVCLFLIDNADGVTDAIVREINRAKSHPKKSLYLFCNQNEKKSTQIQEELTGAKGAKYYVIDNFEDFAKQGYKDLINDICNIYRNYCKNRLTDTEFGEYKHDKLETGEVDIGLLEKRILERTDKSKSYIRNVIHSIKQEINDSKEIDNYFEQFLKVLWGEKSINEFNIGLFLEFLKKEQNEDINQVVKLRWQAIQFYWIDDLNTALNYLNDALILAKEKDLPSWFIQDILIDLRNIQNLKGQLENKFFIESDAQKELNSMSQGLFYPLIDKYEKYLYQEINKENSKNRTKSPYSVRLGNNLDVYVKYLNNIYVIAAFNGSLTQMLLLKNRIKDVAFQLCEEYEDWEFRVLLLKMSMVIDDSKQTERYISYYNNVMGKMNSKDANEIYKFTDSIPIKTERLKSKFQVFKHLGYFFSDDDYDLILSNLIEETYDWIEKEDRVVLLGNIIISSIQENKCRINSNIIVEVCIKILNKKMYRFYDNIFDLLETLELKEVRNELLDSLLKEYICIILNKEVASKTNRLLNAVISFRKQKKEGTEKIDQIVQESMNESDIETYFLETTNKNDDIYVMKYIQEIKNNIKRQGENGKYSIKAYDSYIIIKNILEENHEIVDVKILDEIVNVCVDSLIVKNLTFLEKISAIQLIIYIKLNFTKIDYNYEDLYDILLENEQTLFVAVSDIIQKYSEITLKFNYIMLQIHLKKLNIGDLINILLEVNNEEEFEKIQCLHSIINAFNKEFFEQIDYNIQNIFTQFVLNMKNDNNQNIRYLVVKAILEMITTENKSYMLTELSKSMDYDNVFIKNLIINNFNKLSDIDSDITALMIKKAKVDNHYFVREKAKKYIEKNTI
ncbi:hypothetical protein [Clostridium cylindrosporum]|uniref:Uncharacterized protein n=1 Tax=Clostridium cylindrosporum DSM 605 TaxID=1121307 RepID=A0A0J8DAT8_CLOCY|nr:hypothetical protein [Clostridium cylindrosporum]KMT22967.1 hypothetical protein CLCY_7c00140 [Clostridium cylindrosporum DSM 605]